MNRRPFAYRTFVFAGWVLIVWPAAAQAQQAPAARSLQENLAEFVAAPAVSGYEGQLGDRIRMRIAGSRSTADNLGDVLVTIGSGSPRRLIVTPIDEPGFVTSNIADDGYIRVQRLPQFGLPPILNELSSAQPVRVRTGSGKWIAAREWTTSAPSLSIGGCSIWQAGNSQELPLEIVLGPRRWWNC
jgi:hypothetical protein